MHHGRTRRHQAQVRTVRVSARVVGEPLGMAAEADLVVGGVKAAVTCHQFAFGVALEARARNHIEHTISAVSVFGGITAAFGLDVVDVLGVKLRADVTRNIRVRHRDAIDEPAHLVSASDVKLVVDEGGSRHKIGDHGQAVGAVRARRSGYVLTIDNGPARPGIRIHHFRRGRDLNLLPSSCQHERKMKHRCAVGSDRDALQERREACRRNLDRVLSQSHRLELELPVCV